MKTETRLIEKQKELIKMISPHGAEFWGDETDVYFKLLEEISALEKELEQEGWKLIEDSGLLKKPFIPKESEESKSMMAEEIIGDYLINGTGVYEGMQLVTKSRCLKAMESYALSKQLPEREELIKFFAWQNTLEIDETERVVDEYLKQR